MRPTVRWSRRVITLGLASTVIACTEAPGPDGTRTYVQSEYGLAFEYPSRFVVGSYARSEAEATDDVCLFCEAAVLVEPDLLGSIPRDSIPVGAIPTITVQRIAGSRATFMRRFLREEYKGTVGDRTVYRLPGYPGPYGDQAHYYLVPIGDTALYELLAHRYYFNRPVAEDRFPETGYDRVIERIVSTLDRVD